MSIDSFASQDFASLVDKNAASFDVEVLLKAADAIERHCQAWREVMHAPASMQEDLEHACAIVNAEAEQWVDRIAEATNNSSERLRSVFKPRSSCDLWFDSEPADFLRKVAQYRSFNRIYWAEHDREQVKREAFMLVQSHLAPRIESAQEKVRPGQAKMSLSEALIKVLEDLRVKPAIEGAPAKRASLLKSPRIDLGGRSMADPGVEELPGRARIFVGRFEDLPAILAGAVVQHHLKCYDPSSVHSTNVRLTASALEDAKLDWLAGVAQSRRLSTEGAPLAVVRYAADGSKDPEILFWPRGRSFDHVETVSLKEVLSLEDAAVECAAASLRERMN